MRSIAIFSKRSGLSTFLCKRVTNNLVPRMLEMRLSMRKLSLFGFERSWQPTQTGLYCGINAMFESWCSVRLLKVRVNCKYWKLHLKSQKKTIFLLEPLHTYKRNAIKSREEKAKKRSESKFPVSLRAYVSRYFTLKYMKR